MKERISKLLGNGVESRLTLGTFHSVCRRYLVTYGHLIGLKKDFGIADSSDTIGIIKRIIKRLGLSIDPRKTQSRISSSKSRGISQVELAPNQAKEKNVEQQEFVQVFEAYEDQLATSNLLDYDDLLLRCVDLLSRHPTCVSNVEAVLIDEFQDTNVVQFDLMRLFATHKKRVTTVGDPDQSIYGWRSAEIENLERMQGLYPDTLVIHLKDNYRSSGAILFAAHEVIEQDESRPSKPLLPTHCPGTAPVLRRLPSSEIEGFWVVSEIQRIIALTGSALEFSDFAVLLRSASLSRNIESAMGKAGLPYRMVGGQRFFDRIEIKILLDYLRVVSQPFNNDALTRIINVPTRGIGATTVKGLLEDAEAKRTSLWTHLREFIQGHRGSRTKMSKVAESGLGLFINTILTARNKMLDSARPHSPVDLLRYIIKKLDFQPFLEKTHSDDHETRWANVEELVAQASEYSVLNGEATSENEDKLPQIEGLEQVNGNPAEDLLSKFLANVALATELQREDEDEEDRPQSQVTISTIHAAKGLEWPVVFVPSAYEGSIPHSRAEDTDEERRLLYVAMTRAQALLYMSCPKKNSQREEATLSPFLSTKRVSRCLTDKGSVINSGTVNDICRILGRPLPTQSSITDACNSLESHNDDIWPLNGEEDAQAIGARWSKWNAHDGYNHLAKRRRLETKKGIEKGENRDVMMSRDTSMLSTVGTSTTMQNSSAFSYNGFISATSQLHQTELLNGVDASEDAPKLKSRGRPTSVQAGQGTLASFWAKGDRLGNQSQRPTVGQAIAEELGSDLSTYDPHSAHILNQKSSASVTAEPVFTPIEDLEHMKRRPLASIPQSLAAHRLPTFSKINRPSLDERSDALPKKQYVFLSSSPPQEALQRGAEEPVREVRNFQVTHGLEVGGETSVGCDLKPLKTMHATSISEIQSAPQNPIRTLGVRRSMNGWTAERKQGFSVPKIRNKFKD